MLSSAVPSKFPIPWANAAGGSFIRPIPEASQIGIQNGAASLTDGFVPDNFQVIAAGGVPPFGQDMNGILKLITQIEQWEQAGGGYVYDSAFSTAIGGYPKGARLNSAVVLGRQWLSTVDSNTTDPDSVSAANWVTPPGQNPSGTPIPSFSSTIPFGSVAANALTIGNAASNATNRANSDTLLLFRFVWLTFSNSECPLLNSAGSPVSRGANPDADYAANNALTLPNGKGASLIGVDNMGGSASTFLNGVPVAIGNSTTPGSIVGENLHPLVAAENGIHNHGVNDPTHVHGYEEFSAGSGTVGGGGAFGANIAANTNAAATNISIQNQGSGTPHNTVQRSMTVYWNLAL